MSGSAPSSSGRSHPRFARAFARAVPEMDRRGGEEHRRDLLKPASGVAVEIGSGTGGNFRHYPAAVTRVLAFEPDPYLRSLSAAAATRAPAPVEVADAVAEALPLPEGTADTVVLSLVLCSVTDVELALRESRRVLRPGGMLLFYEHVRSAHPLVARLQDAGTPVWRRLAGNCHPNRDALAAIRAAGFEVTDVRAFGFAPGGWPSLPHILGAARAPLA